MGLYNARGKWEMHTEYLFGKRKRKYYLEILNVDTRIILECKV
jgi:hypothetical protein